ncbi:MAG: TMEM165/GDT1 family protein [Jiangellaceae bacterium]
MADLWTAFLISFGVVFVAELGDKSQLMALTFATRFRPLLVMVGIGIATALINAISVAVGYGLGLALPTRWISLAAGLVFIGFAIWTLLDDDEDGEDVPVRAGHSVIFTVGSAFLLAELGDKTMLATITLASQNGWAGTWLGATLGMIAAAVIAIVVGRQLGKRLPERVVRLAAAALFGVFGIWLLVEALA